MVTFEQKDSFEYYPVQTAREASELEVPIIIRLAATGDLEAKGTSKGPGSCNRPGPIVYELEYDKSPYGTLDSEVLTLVGYARPSSTPWVDGYTKVTHEMVNRQRT
ncbi:hypothetical protein EDB89DRAFT_2241690 [Lactarius sanguifluus]|nr:hypothetical protein EDB89DRAFT_2241690 [Lactarius sanguifluus]